MKISFLEVLLLVFCFICAIQALDYSDLESIGFQNCPRRNRCSLMGNIPFKDMTCECDSECSVFGDCCIDADRIHSRTFSLKCMPFDEDPSHAVYVINTCPSSYVGDELIRRLCQNDDLNDLVKSAPVTDTLNRKIYLNHYCALCNEVPLNFLTSWTISARKIENPNIGKLSLEHIRYHSTEKTWGYDLDGQFQPCRIIFDKPPSVSTIGRSCKPNLISTCAGSWVGEEHRKACESYMSIVKDSRNNLYKNPHCAICNGIPSGEMLCLPIERQSHDVLLGRNKRDFFGLGLTYNPVNRCPEGKIYDPILKHCMTCAYFSKNGRCVKHQ